MLTNIPVRVTFNGRVIDATAILVSPNRKSIMLQFDDSLHTSDGGMYLGTMAVMFAEQTQKYVDLLMQEEIQIEWL